MGRGEEKGPPAPDVALQPPSGVRERRARLTGGVIQPKKPDPVCSCPQRPPGEGGGSVPLLRDRKGQPASLSLRLHVREAGAGSWTSLSTLALPRAPPT